MRELTLALQLMSSLALQAEPQPSAEGRVLQLLHAAHQTALAAANVATARAVRPDVKRYVQQLREGHTAADAAVQGAAQRLGIALVPSDAVGQTAEEIARSGGVAFDHAFLRAEVSDDDRIIADVETLTPQLKDPGVEKLSNSELKTLRALEQKADKLDAKL